MVNENYEPTDTEEEVLDVLREEWRANPMLIREETSLGKGTINTALSNLTSAGWVLKVTRGLYEFVEDPRETEEKSPVDTNDRAPAPTEMDLADTLDEMESEDTLRAAMEARLDEIHIKGRASAVEATRREALIYAWERLREEGEMRPRDLADDVLGKFFDDPDLNYSTTPNNHPGYQLLDNFLRETLLQLPGVHSTGRVWQFREEVESDEDSSGVYDPTEEF